VGRGGIAVKIIDLIKPDDLIPLIQLIKKFAERTETPFHVQINEVSSSLLTETALCLVGKIDDTFKGYLCGFFYSRIEFVVSQIYSEDNELTGLMIRYMEDILSSRKVEKIIGFVKPNPDIFRKYGYSRERVVMSKKIGG
jgi:hypothetical protein